MTTYESDSTQGKQREREKNILLICSQTDCQNVLLLKPSILKSKWLAQIWFQCELTACEPLKAETQWTVQGTSIVCLPQPPSTWKQMSQQDESLYLLLLTQTSFQKPNSKKAVSHRRHQLPKQKYQIQDICLSPQWQGTLTPCYGSKVALTDHRC